MERNLKFIFGDCPDAEIKKCEVVIKVIEVETQQRFKVKDDSMMAFLQFQDGTTQMSSRVNVGATLRLFSIEKINQDTLLFKKTSYLTEDTSGRFDDDAFLDTMILVNKPHNYFIYDNLLVKVLKIYEKRETTKGIKFQKALLGDHLGCFIITFWRDCADMLGKLLVENKVYSLKNFSIDDYMKTKDSSKPKDIVYVKAKTEVKEITSQVLMEKFRNINMNQMKIEGRLRFLDRIYEYKSCPGKVDSTCGKTVKPGQTHCSKTACAIPLTESMLVDDYVVTLVVFDEENDAHPITAFRKNLVEFERDGATIFDRLARIINKEVKAVISKPKPDDNPILSKVELL